MDCGGFVLENFMHINNHDNHSICLRNNYHWKYHPSLVQLITNSKIVFPLSTVLSSLPGILKALWTDKNQPKYSLATVLLKLLWHLST